MIVPYEEKKIPTYQDKINAILKNKNINKEDKVKLINQILINKKHNHPIKIIQNDTDSTNEKNEQLEEFEQNDNQPDTYDQSNYYDIQEEEIPSEEDELNENISTENTFTDADDYLAPAFQTRSQKVLATPWKNSKKRKRKETEIETKQKKRALNLTHSERINQAINTKKKKKVLKKKRLSKTPQNNKILTVNQNRKKNPITISADKIKLLKGAEASKQRENQVDVSMKEIQNGNGWQRY